MTGCPRRPASHSRTSSRYTAPGQLIKDNSNALHSPSSPRFDPSNPVVCYDGSLKSSLFSKMREAADSADLVLVLGTSLSGLNSDRVALQPAKRSLAGKSLGTVIVNLQQTPHDGVATLRLFGGTDRVFELLMEMISPPLEICPLIAPPQVQLSTGSLFTFAYV